MSERNTYQDITANDIISFLPNYPAIKDSQFQYKIARKKEFYDHKLERIEEKPPRGELLDHQLLMKRFFSPYTPYKEGLVSHGMGTGKSCTASAIIENYKNTTVDKLPRLPALVLVKNEDLARSLQNEIVNVCTYEVYKVRLTEKEELQDIQLKEKTKIRRLNDAVSKTYMIYTYGDFISKHIVNQSDEVIKRRWSNRAIIMDEPHILRIQPRVEARERKRKGEITKRSKREKELGKELAEQSGEYTIGETIETPQPPIGLEIIEPEDLSRLKLGTTLYEAIFRFMHLVSGGPKILLTGTPIWDQTNEFASIMNLILPKNLLFPTGKEFYNYYDEDTLTEEGQEEILRRIRNRVFYLRPMITIGQRIQLGVTKPWFKYVTAYPNGMSDFQAGYVHEATTKVEMKTIRDRRGRTVQRTVIGGVVYKDARDASNMVIPEFDASGNVIGGVYGQNAFNKYATSTTTVRGRAGKPSRKVTTYQIDNRFLRNELANNLQEYSIKFASIIDKIKSNPREVSFVYNDLVTGTGGCIMFALVLKLHGYKWLKTSEEVAAHTGGKSFVVFTSDPETTNNAIEIQKILKVSGSKQNAYADKLQVIIGSEKVSLGISILNCRQIHITLPDFNIASIDQPIFRGIRFGSLVNLPEDEQYIKIYIHTAVQRDINQTERDVKRRAALLDQEQAPDVGYPRGALFSDVSTIDVYILRLAEEKDYKHAQIYRLIKKASGDCPLTYRRNVLPEDVDGSRDCNYTDCNYECDSFPPTDTDTPDGVWDYNVPPEDIDYVTYNLYYSQKPVAMMIDFLRSVFSTRFSMQISDALEMATSNDPNISSYIFYLAIDTLISHRIPIRNKYGFISYLKEDNDILFLSMDISDAIKYGDVVYTEFPVVVDHPEGGMDEIVEAIEFAESEKYVPAFFEDPSIETLENISYKTRVLLFEYVYGIKKRNKAAKILYNLYKDDVYTMEDGAKVHTLYAQEFTGVSYDVASKDIKATGVTRIYNPEIKQPSRRWQYITDVELEKKYLDEIKEQQTAQKEQALQNSPVGAFGWISKRDGEFRIFVKQSKGKPRGKKCVFFSVPELIDLLINRLKFMPKARSIYKEMSREELLNGIRGRSGYDQLKKGLDKKSDRELARILSLMTMDIAEVCQVVRKWFEDNDLLYTFS